MNALDLFQAIGCLEEQRLARSELGFPSRDQKEGPIMKNDLNKSENSAKKPRLTAGRVLRNILAAALILSMLTVTAYAVGGYVIFDSPQEMLDKLFGDNTGYDHKDVTQWTDPEKPGAVYDSPGFDRAPVDQEAAGEAAALVSPVGQSISWEGYTLRVDANLFDQVTDCGVLTYTIENPDGLPEYQIQANGRVYFPNGEILDQNQYGYSYVIADQSSDTKLTAAFYYQLRNPQTTDLELSLTPWAVITPEEGIQDSALYEQSVCPEKIAISKAAMGALEHMTAGQGTITVSPIAIHVEDVTLLGVEEGASFDSIKLRFQDGSEYIIRDEATSNYIFWVGSGEKNDSTLMFNRIIDVGQVTTVILDDVEYPVA